MAYFNDPPQAVEAITKMLIAKDYVTLSHYYDLSETDVDRDRLCSGDFFIQTQRPEVAHPGGFWRHKQPFSPGFKYAFHTQLPGDMVEVTVQIEIDEGGGMTQTGLDRFYLRKSKDGYQLVPKPLSGSKALTSQEQKKS